MDAVYERDALTGYYYKISEGTKTRVSRNEALSQIGGARINMVSTPDDVASQTPWLKTAHVNSSDIVVTYDPADHDDEATSDEVVARMGSDLPYPVNGMEWFKAAGVKPHHVGEICHDAGKSDTIKNIADAWGTKLLEPEPVRDPSAAEQILRDDEYVIDGVPDVVRMPSKDMETYQRTVNQPAAKAALENCKLLDGGDEKALVAREKDMCTYELTCNKNLGLAEGIRTEADYEHALGVSDGKYKHELERCRTIGRWKCGEAVLAEQYISSKNYKLIHNTGEGDCLFIAYTNWLHIKEQMDRGDPVLWSMTDPDRPMANGITLGIHQKLKTDAHSLRAAAVKWLQDNQDEVYPRFGQVKYYVVKGAFAQFASGSGSYGISDAVTDFNALPAADRLDDTGTPITVADDNVYPTFVTHINGIGSLRGSSVPARRQLATTVERFVDLVFKHYCKEMLDINTYGTESEIFALSQLFENTIKLYLTADNIRTRFKKVVELAKERRRKGVAAGNAAVIAEATQTEADATKKLMELTPDLFGSEEAEYVYTNDMSDDIAPIVRIYNYSQSHYELIISKKTLDGAEIDLMEPRIAAFKNILETHFEYIDESGNVDEMAELINSFIQDEDLELSTLSELVEDLNWTSTSVEDADNYAETLSTEAERMLHVRNMRSLFGPQYYNHPTDLEPIKDDVAKMLAKIKEYAVAQRDVGPKFILNRSDFDAKTVGLVLPVVRPDATYDKLGADIPTIAPDKLTDNLVDQPDYFHKMFGLVGIDGYIRDTEGFNESLLELMNRLMQCYNMYPKDTLKELKSWMVKLALLYYDQQPSAYKKKPNSKMSFYEIAKYLYDDEGNAAFALDKALPTVVEENKGSINRDFDLYKKLSEILGGVLSPSEIEDFDDNLTDRQLIEKLVDGGMFNDEFASEVTDDDIITNFEGPMLEELVKQMKIEYVLSKVYVPLDTRFRASHSAATKGYKLDYQVDAEYYMIGKLRELILHLLEPEDPTEKRSSMTYDEMLNTLAACKGPIPDGMTIYEHAATCYESEPGSEPKSEVTKIAAMLSGIMEEEDIQNMLAEAKGDIKALMEQLADLEMLTPFFEETFAEVVKTKLEGVALAELMKRIKIEHALRHIGKGSTTGTVQAAAEEKMRELLKPLLSADKMPTNLQMMNAFGRCKVLAAGEDLYTCAAKSVGRVKIVLRMK